MDSDRKNAPIRISDIIAEVRVAPIKEAAKVFQFSDPCSAASASEPRTPTAAASVTLAQTIALLPLVIEETVLAGETDDNRIILENRIMKPPSERLTLEAVGELMPTRITRERVRQKEAMILRHLAASLVHGDYAKAPYHFRPEFTAPWRKAAKHFSSIEGDISLNDLITGLELAWETPAEAFQDQLPLITAIITGELPTGGDFRKSMAVETNLLSQGAGEALSVPLKLLQLKRAADVLPMPPPSKSTLGNGLANQDAIRKVGSAHRLQ